MQRKNKKSMEIENIPFNIPEPIQHQLIDKVLAMTEIGTIAKCYLIRKNNNINTAVAFQYLLSKNKETMLTYLKRPDMSMPPPNSASKWSITELEYYLITRVDVDATKFGLDNINPPVEVMNFLKMHDDDFLAFYKKKLQTKNVPIEKISKFAQKYINYFKETNRESHIDNLMASFLDNVFGKDFIVDTQTPFKLTVNDTECEAITDVCVFDGTSGINGVVTVEDKTENNNEGDAFAQMIAEGIAVSEQSDWKEEWPVFMVLSKGLRLNFYQAIFSKIFLDNVRNGFDCAQKTFIYHLDQEFSLENEKGRFSAARVFTFFREECLKRRI